MKPIRRYLTLIGSFAVALFALGCASSNTQSKENLLVTAGFKTFPADTPAKQKLLNSLPAGQISAMQRKGRTYFIYPELASNVALVGTQKEYTAYGQLKSLKNISERNLEISEMNSLPAAGWGAWGGWGGGYGW
jgi:hypothetical protein